VSASDTVNASDRVTLFNVISVETLASIERERERQRETLITPETSSFARTFPNNSLHVEMFIEFTRFRGLRLRRISTKDEQRNVIIKLSFIV